MQMNTISPEDFLVTPSTDELGNIAALVKQAADLQQQIEGMEEFLKKAKAELHALLTRTLPDLMAASHTSEFTTDDGISVRVKDFVRGSIPKDPERRTLALMWLEKAGAGDLIKNSVNATFDRGQDNLAGRVTETLEELGIAYEADRTVHPQTLAAFARERIRNDEELPLELLGLYAGKNAEIKQP